MSELVDVEPHRARSIEVRENGAEVRVHLDFNVEQDLDRVEVDEQTAQVTVTAWVGWRADGCHVRDRAILAAGRTATFVDVALTENLGGRMVRDGAGSPPE